MMYTLTLLCQMGCGRQVGEVQLKENLTTDQYRAKAGIVDQRCSQCDIDQGTFKEMTQKYVEATGKSPLEAEKFVVKNPKRGAFDQALETEEKDTKEKKKASDAVQSGDIINTDI